MSDVANDFYNALYQLYETGNGCFNKLGIKATQDLIIFGESYAGKYVPAIALKIKR
jgi:vitellogenic carboxypeptidase-like protein/serine carboxypeptidase 1